MVLEGTVMKLFGSDWAQDAPLRVRADEVDLAVLHPPELGVFAHLLG